MPDARKTALTILNILDQENITLDRAIEDVQEGSVDGSRKDRALTNALVFGVTRWRGKIDWIISQYSKTPLKKINSNILNILRIGIFQILQMDRIPDSAAVNTAVELAKPKAKPWIIKYINGLLRNIARNQTNIPFPSMDKNLPGFLCISKSFPKWLIEKWLTRFGKEQTIAMCEATNAIPPITIRTNTLKISREKLQQKLTEEVGSIIPTPWSPFGLHLTAPKTPIPRIKAFHNGWFQVQDEAAQLVPMLVDPKPGNTILDACAGLGGKTALLAQMMKNQGQITALDSSQKKLRKLEQEMVRLGINIVQTCQHDLSTKPSINSLGQFDHILLDAPCSGLGVIRRNPDIKWAESKKDLIRYQKRQLLFLSNLTDLVKPGGRLTYTVCSFEPEETESVIEAFLNIHKDFMIEDRNKQLPVGTNAGIYCNKRLTTFPHQHNMDGFFSVCFQKKASG